MQNTSCDNNLCSCSSSRCGLEDPEQRSQTLIREASKEATQTMDSIRERPDLFGGSVCEADNWPGLEKPWRDSWKGSAASSCSWRSKGLRNASAGWRTESVGSRCAGGFPSGHRTCPSGRSAPANTRSRVRTRTQCQRDPVAFSAYLKWFGRILYAPPLSGS